MAYMGLVQGDRGRPKNCLAGCPEAPQSGLMCLQEGAQVEAPLGVDVAKFRGHRAGMAGQATTLMTIGLRGLPQIVSTAVDGIASGIERIDRTGMQTGFQLAGKAG